MSCPLISSTTSQQSRQPLMATPLLKSPTMTQPLLASHHRPNPTDIAQTSTCLRAKKHLKDTNKQTFTHIHKHKNKNATTRQNHLTHNKTHDHLTHLQLPFCLQLVNRLLAANAPAPARGLHIAAAPRHRSSHCSRKRKTRLLGVSVGLGLGLGVDGWCRNNADGDFCLLEHIAWTTSSSQAGYERNDKRCLTRIYTYSTVCALGLNITYVEPKLGFPVTTDKTETDYKATCDKTDGLTRLSWVELSVTLVT